MDWKYIVASLVAVLLIGYSIGRYVNPPKEITKVEVQEREVVRKDVQTIVKEITRPDGTKETVTETTDKSVEKKDKSIESIAIKPLEKQWHASLGAERNFTEEKNIYSMTIERRIFLSGFAGVRVNTEKEVGLVLGMEF